jgi:3,4-dihydroxy 2-butanone 4-phosphate synthase/GTP cyclohydrolase II
MQIDFGDAASPQTLRQYGLGAQILSSLGLSRLILLSNSPQPRIVGLDAYGLSIEGTRKIPLE